MPAIDLERSAAPSAPLTVKIRWCTKKIEGLLELKSHITLQCTASLRRVQLQAMYCVQFYTLVVSR